MKNIYDDFSEGNRRRLGVGSPGIKLAEWNEATGIKMRGTKAEKELGRLLGVANDIAIPGIKSMFDAKGVPYRVESRVITYERLLKIIHDDRYSYPILTLGSSYLTESYGRGVQGASNRSMNHCLIVLSIDESVAWIYDPFFGVFKRNKNADRKSTIPTVSILNHWERGHPSYEATWLERVGTTLDEY